MEKEKKIISESTVNSQRIGITLKLEAIKFKVKEEFYWCTLFHFISENKIIHIWYISLKHARLVWYKNWQNTAMKPRKDELQTRSAPTFKQEATSRLYSGLHKYSGVWLI